MKIVHTVPSLSLSAGGPSRSVSQLCNTLVRSVQVSLVTTSMTADQCSSVSNKLRLIKVPVQNAARVWPGELSRFRAALEQELTQSTHCLVHQHGIWLSSSHETAISATSNNIPLILSPRGMLEPWSLRRSRLKKTLAWLAYQKTDLCAATAFHATAQDEANSIRSLGFKQPIAVIPNGVIPPELGRAAILPKKTAGCDPHPLTALFLSRLNPKKGLPLLVEAWSKLRPPGWQLLIAGNDDSNTERNLSRQIELYGLSKSVKVLGPAYGEEKASLFRKADLFILPSYSENFGIVVAEALSYGIPVLTTTGCPWQELVEEECGWWVEPTVQGIFEGLKQACSTTREHLRHMGGRGLALTNKKYRWAAISDNMLAFYRWVLFGGSRPHFVV